MNEFLTLAAGLACGLTLATALWHVLSRRKRPSIANALPNRLDAAILFRDGMVIDVTPDAADLLDDMLFPGMDWEGVYTALHMRFPDLPKTPPDIPIELQTRGKQAITLKIFPEPGGLRLRLEVPPWGIHPELGRSLQDLAGRRIMANAMAAMPFAVWRADKSNNVIWSNRAYQDLLRVAGRESLIREEDHGTLFEFESGVGQESSGLRSKLDLEDGSTLWFETSSAPDGGGTINFAKPIDGLIAAEKAQRDFVQTLSKTFAHVPLGLAVFDRERRLALFNPALMNLTRLSADFLAGRPTLFSFFDGLRENRMMPEPKNYAQWREGMSEVIDAARDDRYSETWELSSGGTYRITGRPHPDGAVAFLIEDISSEISLTRRFRSEVDLVHSVLDHLDEAVAVFSQQGGMLFANEAYMRLWPLEPMVAPMTEADEINIHDATAYWQELSGPGTHWHAIRDFVLNLRDRSSWEARVIRTDDIILRCHVEPVSGGATLVRFTRDDLSVPLEREA